MPIVGDRAAVRHLEAGATGGDRTDLSSLPELTQRIAVPEPRRIHSQRRPALLCEVQRRLRALTPAPDGQGEPPHRWPSHKSAVRIRCVMLLRALRTELHVRLRDASPEARGLDRLDGAGTRLRVAYCIRDGSKEPGSLHKQLSLLRGGRW